MSPAIVSTSLASRIRIIVELKAIDTVPPIHQAKLLSYLKTADLRLGLIINFNVSVLKDGIQRMVR